AGRSRFVTSSGRVTKQVIFWLTQVTDFPWEPIYFLVPTLDFGDVLMYDCLGISTPHSTLLF
ncbi:hypothetical protein LINPERHAP1_LOCUS36898, partial [Linum perenne]